MKPNAKLNNYQRDAIIASIMEDTPRMDDSKTKVEVQEALVKAMSPAVRKVYRDQPKALKGLTSYDLFDRQSHYFITGDVNFNEVAKPWRDRVDARNKAQKELRAIVYGCSTLNQLKKLVPEFEKYMPNEDAPTKNLPVVANLVTSLMTLGWPKGATK